jgi:hypothetical protein
MELLAAAKLSPQDRDAKRLLPRGPSVDAYDFLRLVSAVLRCNGMFEHSMLTV